MKWKRLGIVAAVVVTGLVAGVVFGPSIVHAAGKTPATTSQVMPATSGLNVAAASRLAAAPAIAIRSSATVLMPSLPPYPPSAPNPKNPWHPPVATSAAASKFFWLAVW